MTTQPPPIASKALEANFQQTASTVEISPRYAPLREAVARYQGLSSRLEHLLYEISHPYRNWQLIISELRPFVLKNISHYLGHPQGPDCFALFSSIFLEALKDSRKNSKVVAQTVEALLAYADKLISSLTPEVLPRYADSLNAFLDQLARLDETDSGVMMQMVQGHHPLKKMAGQLISLGRKAGEQNYSCAAAARLLRKILSLNYACWLSEDDPQPWFESQCGTFCAGWQAGPQLAAISHARMREHLAALEMIKIEEEPYQALSQILQLPAHIDIVRLYRDIPAKLSEDSSADSDPTLIENRKLLFLFRIMDTAGLSLIHEETLREINRSLVQLIRTQSFEEIEQFFITTFHLLKANVRKYPHTSLQCIQVIGGEVFQARQLAPGRGLSLGGGAFRLSVRQCHGASTRTGSPSPIRPI